MLYLLLSLIQPQNSPEYIQTLFYMYIGIVFCLLTTKERTLKHTKLYLKQLYPKKYFSKKLLKFDQIYDIL